MLPGEKPNLSGLSLSEVEAQVDAVMEDLSDEQLRALVDGSIGEFDAGKIVKGVIMQLISDDALVDIGYKSEAFLPRNEVDSHDEVQVGDTIEVLIELIDEQSGVILLSKRKADRIRGWEKIVELHKVGDIVTGQAVRKIKGGLLVDIGVPVFLPASQIDIRRTGDVGRWIGREVQCMIIKIDEERRNIVLSRRKLLEEERDRMKKDLLAELERGQIRRGVVKNLTDFGAFIDLGGIDGLLHITDISWGRVAHPSDALSIDQTVEVKVLDFDLERERISLGLKQLSPNPWSAVQDKYPIGSSVSGEVVNIVPYGAFVKLEDGVEGLVHVSEMSWTRQIDHPSDVVDLGEQVDVVVLDINQNKQEISLGMKQATENPWEQVKAKYPAGTRIRGLVRNLTSYGAFVEIEEGIDGLLHVNDMSWTRKISHPTQIVNKGEEIEAVVLEVDPERKRIALGLKQLEEDPWDSAIEQQFQVGQKVQGKVTKLTSFGAFIEIGLELEGLLHISEMAEEKVERPEDVLQVGETVEVKIINLDKNERKIGLSLKALHEPEVPAQDETGETDGTDESPVADTAPEEPAPAEDAPADEAQHKNENEHKNEHEHENENDPAPEPAQNADEAGERTES